MELEDGAVLTNITTTGPSFVYDGEEDASNVRPAVLVEPAAEVVERVAFRSFCRDFRAAQKSRTNKQEERLGSEADTWTVLPADRKRACVLPSD